MGRINLVVDGRRRRMAGRAGLGVRHALDGAGAAAHCRAFGAFDEAIGRYAGQWFSLQRTIHAWHATC